MTRGEYLDQLKNLLASLPSDESEKSIQYYADYFESANDDEKVISELGSPDALAKIILDKYLPKETDTASDSDDGTSNENSDYYDEALYYSFKKNSVKNLSFDFGAASVVMITGDEFAVETRGVSENDLSCKLDKNGTLRVSNTRRLPLFGLFSHDRKSRFVPRILVSIPKGANLFSAEIKVGAGSLVTKDVQLKIQKGKFSVEAGQLVLDQINGGKIDARCGMGNFVFKGTLSGKSNIDCGMGSIKMELRGLMDDYSFDAKVGLGDVRINGEKQLTVGQNLSRVVKDNHLSINCGMGSVNVEIGN